MRRWHQALARCEANAEPYVLATVLATSGSAPRPSSTKMLITAHNSYDSIGGGRLEWLVQERARTLIATHQRTMELQHFPLAVAAEQCCGGSVTVLLEPCNTALRPLWLFGAGHVGQRVVELVQELPFRLHWIDNRKETATLDPAPSLCDDPLHVLDDIGADDAIVIVTHDHALDYRLVSALLRNTECRSIGLIGSRTKAERFAARLQRDGLGECAVQRLRCPIGAAVVAHKQPMAVAVAIVAELLAESETRNSGPPLTWQQMKLSLVGQTLSEPGPGERA